jgi:hypothetical protein
MRKGPDNMKRLGLLLLTMLAASCAEPAAPVHPVVGIGGGGIPNQWLAPLNPVTGNSATIVVFDTTATPSHADRIMVSGFFNQAVTVLYQVEHSGSVTWRTANGSGDAITASTQTTFEYVVSGLNSRVEIVTGSTGPTTSEVDIGVMYERAKP